MKESGFKSLRSKIRVLLVGGNNEDVFTVKKVLGEYGQIDFHIELTDRLSSGLEKLSEEDIDLILLNSSLPDSQGMDSLREIRSLDQDIPIIILSEKEDESLASESVEQGVQDYLVKDQMQNGDLLIRLIQHAMERGRIRKMMQKSEASIRNIVENNSDGMIVLDTEGIACFTNYAAEYLLGRKADEIRGSHLGFQIKPGESTEMDFITSGGEPVTVEVRMVEIEWEESKAYLASLRDITDRKKMEAELRSTYQQVLNQQKSLIEEERLQVILQMAGVMIHELSQPLTVLLGNLGLLGCDMNNSEEFDLCVSEIKKAGENIADIIQKIQTIRHYDSKPYYENISIVNIDQGTHILVIEDSDADFIKLSCIIENYGKIKLSRAKTLNNAYNLLTDGTYDLIILDYFLPDGTGLEFLKSMDEKEISIPVVVITGQSDEVIASQFVKAGVYDYLSKANVSDKSVARVISNALEKFQLKNEMKQALTKMEEIATRDELTDLYNRHYFTDAMEREVATAKRYGKDLSVCMIYLDKFKKTNDTYGRTAGDTVLKTFSKLLKEDIRKSDLLCRYGGEEFAIILTCTDMKKAQMFGERLRKKTEAQPFEYKGVELNVTISVGISSYSKTADQTPDTLLEEAERALGQAKNTGRNKVSVFF